MGALDVQSSRHDSFDEQQTSVLQTMADQIAVAIYNARLYQESVQRLEEFEDANRRGTEQSWMDYVRGQRVGFLSSQAGFETDTDLLTLRQSARDQKQSVIGDITERETIPIAVPIQWRGYILGTVEWEIPAKTFDRNQVLLAEELVNRLAISLENARLFEESSRATERERLVNEIAAKVTGQTNIDEILQTAVREVGRALRVPQVNIHLDKSPGSKGNGDREQGNPV
jgi:GAF domain-containing protein